MNLQPRTEDVLGTTEILQTTQGMIFKVGGVTLDAAAFPADSVIKAGTAVSIAANGLAKPWADADTGLAFLTVHDVTNKNGNVVTGALEAGFVKTAALTGVTAAFRTAVDGRIHFR